MIMYADAIEAVAICGLFSGEGSWVHGDTWCGLKLSRNNLPVSQ